MPCLGTAISQSCFRKHLVSSWVPPLCCGNPSDISAFGQKKKWASLLKLCIQMPTEGTLNSLEHSMHGLLLVKAVATFETTIVTHSIDVPVKDDELFFVSTPSSQLFQFSNGDADEMGEREKLWRMKISKANKGNVPWNKGRKHSPETLRRIRERTQLAIQKPKVMSCQNEADKLRACTEEYRKRVCSALAVYHSNAAGTERKSRKKPSGESTRTRSSVKKKSSDSLTGSNKSDEISARKEGSRMIVVATPSYKDPLANSKLEMIKKIRFQRAKLENKKREAAERARLLIAEAEKAAKALELATVTSPLARAPLIETRKLIAEATQSLEGIDSRPPILSESSSEAPFPSEFEGISQSRTTNNIPSNRVINEASHPFLSEMNQGESMHNAFELPRLQGNGREATDIAKQMETVPNGQYNIHNNIEDSLPKSSEIENCKRSSRI